MDTSDRFGSISDPIAHKIQRWYGSCLPIPQKSATVIREGGCMQNKMKWMELCERAADEQDPKKLAALILEINFMLEAEELRLVGKVVTQPPIEDSLTAD